MRAYYEAREVTQWPVEPEFIRVEITDKTQAERDTILADIQNIMTGKIYVLINHSCYHQEGLPCTMERLN